MPDRPATPSLADAGWDDGWARALRETADPSLTPGRVARIDRGACTVWTAAGPIRAATLRGVSLAVGDWVTIDTAAASDDLPAVAAVLARRFVIRRIDDAAGAREQVVAANIDAVLLVTAIDGHLGARHLERYLALAWQSGATPVIVISKADLASPEVVGDCVAAVGAVSVGVTICVVSANAATGLADLAPYLQTGRTAALLGLSGAGKSTLVNLLAGVDDLATGNVRADGTGRHTTTHRQLVLLPGGAMLIDTPGMRALSVGGAADGVARTFVDLAELAERCDFHDCAHLQQAGCALRAALAAGEIDAGRLESWLRFRDRPQPTDHGAGRARVTERKRRKATAKAARRGGPADRVEAPAGGAAALAERTPTVPTSPPSRRQNRP